MPFIISICTSPKADEAIWRNPLAQLGPIANINNGNIPEIKEIINTCPKDQKIILLVTGGHGDIDQKRFNEASLDEWKKWIKNQPKGKFNLIILDFCDSSALIRTEMASLLTPCGSIVSNVSTGHGLRASLIESGFSRMGKTALISFHCSSFDLLKGSNVSITKRRATTTVLQKLFCEESVSKIYDSRVPCDMGEVNESKQRGKVIRYVKCVEKSSNDSEAQANPSLDVLPKKSIGHYVCNLDRQLKPKKSKRKIGLFVGSMLTAAATIAVFLPKRKAA